MQHLHEVVPKPVSLFLDEMRLSVRNEFLKVKLVQRLQQAVGRTNTMWTNNQLGKESERTERRSERKVRDKQV